MTLQHKILFWIGYNCARVVSRIVILLKVLKSRVPWLMLPPVSGPVADGFDEGKALGRISGKQSADFDFLCSVLKIEPLSTKLGQLFSKFETPGTLTVEDMHVLITRAKSKNYRVDFIDELLEEGVISEDDVNRYLPIDRNTNLEQWLNNQ